MCRTRYVDIWKIEAVSGFLEPGAILSGLSLFLVPEEMDTVLRKIQGVFATLSSTLYIAFALCIITLRMRQLHAEVQVGSDRVKKHQVQGLPLILYSFALFTLNTLCFVLAFLMYYADRVQVELGDDVGFYITIIVSGVLIGLSWIAFCYHYVNLSAES